MRIWQRIRWQLNRFQLGWQPSRPLDRAPQPMGSIARSSKAARVAMALGMACAIGALSGCATQGAANASAAAIVSETFMVPATDDPAIGIHVRNKHRADRQRFAGERIVLFVHGATYPAEGAFDLDLPGGSWLEIAAARGFDAYFMDVRGYGRSTRPAAMNQPADANPPFADTADAIRDVAAVVDFIRKRRGVAAIDVVGWSWGTTIMGGFAATHNEQVHKLVLYAPVWLVRDAPPISGSGAYRTVTQASARQRGIRGIPDERVEEISPKAWFDRWWAVNMANDPVGAEMTPPVVRAPNGVLKDLAQYWMKGTPVYEPADIQVPTLIVVAEWDRDTPPVMAQEVFARMKRSPDKRLVMLGEGTHAIVLERNRMHLIETVQRFLEE
jgi:pimeloyl-ACP methyl ester carboxylesterase